MGPMTQPNRMPIKGLKPKDLVGIPWRVAFALQADGWYLRQWIPWIKRNAMPESVRSRPVSTCETVFLLSKSSDCYYDYEAVKLPGSLDPHDWIEGRKGRATPDGKCFPTAERNGVRPANPDKQRGHTRKHAGFNARWDKMEKTEQCTGWRATRNSDWFFEGLLSNEEGTPLALVVSPAPYHDAHFATFPPNLIKPCILAGCPVGGLVLDPFGGSGTTGMVALELGRRATLIELNPDYVRMARERTNVTPGLPLSHVEQS